MAQAITEVAVGAAAIAAPFALPGLGIAVSATLAHSLVAIGASMALSGAISGLSELKNNQGGLSVATTSPIGPWGYIYGQQKVGGIEIFRQSNSSQGTSNDKELHRVYAIACHPCVGGGAGAFQLRIDGKIVNLAAAGAGWKSYSPTQEMQPIVSMSRDVNGLVTFKIAEGIANLDGTSIQITEAGDNTFNGVWIVTQPNPSDDTTFQFVCGGPVVASVSGGQCWTLYADYQDKIYIEWLNGNHTSTFVGLLASGTNWSATDLVLGRTLVYVRMGYSQQVFPSSIPNVSFVVYGKNDIYDPRTGTRGYTNNAALCIADFMSIPATKGGFGLTIGTDIPTAQLIAAANICDEPVALAGGGAIARYTCDTFFNLNQTRGAILRDLLSSCAGRLSYQGGQFSIFPGAWLAPTLSLTDSDVVGRFNWKPRLSGRDSANAVKGTYVSPENNYQQADFPPYMEDADHGYVSDPWLAEDQGERIFKEVNLPCTVSSATAQRLAKIELLRTRFQMRGTIRCSMKAYQAVALDVIQITHPRYTWLNKMFEVLSSRFVWDKSGPVPIIAVELDLAETDPSIYDWSIEEQLTPQGYAQPDNVGNSVCDPPNAVVTYSGPGAVINGVTYPSTIVSGADGSQRNSIYVAWQPPNDANVVNGGYLELQWAPLGSSAWLPFGGRISPLTSSLFIVPVSDGGQYNVQMRAVNCAGVASKWVLANSVTVSNTYGVSTYSGIPVAPAGTLRAQAFSGGAQILIANFTPWVYPSPCEPSPSILTGLTQGEVYSVYYIDPNFEGGSITPIATQNPNDYLNKPGYFLIGSITTPTTVGPLYRPSGYVASGSSTVVNPAYAYDGNPSDDALLGASCDGAGYPAYGCQCEWYVFPNTSTSASATLNVRAATLAYGGGCTALIKASLDGGSTWTTLFTTTGQVAQALYTMAVPSGTSLANVQVVAIVSSTAGTDGYIDLYVNSIYIQ